MKNLLFIAVVTMLLASCVSTSRNKVSGYLTYETVCLGSKSDGSQRVKGYGKASSKIEAIEMAKKNALKDVIFKGLRGGTQGCEVKPVIFDPNLLETRSDYFNSFFANGGDYAKFVSTEGEATATQEKKEAGNDVTFGVAMTINRAALKQKFIEDKLLNP
jgi:opacity protein-like surface antigen